MKGKLISKKLLLKFLLLSLIVLPANAFVVHVPTGQPSSIQKTTATTGKITQRLTPLWDAERSQESHKENGRNNKRKEIDLLVRQYRTSKASWVDQEGRTWRSTKELDGLKRDGLPELDHTLLNTTDVEPFRHTMGSGQGMLRQVDGLAAIDEERWLHIDTMTLCYSTIGTGMQMFPKILGMHVSGRLSKWKNEKSTSHMFS